MHTYGAGSSAKRSKVALLAQLKAGTILHGKLFRLYKQIGFSIEILSMFLSVKILQSSAIQASPRKIK